MREIIEQELRDIEAREGVRILHAVESGSRAWGFASPDSDYDVRFLYVRPVEDYLRLEQTRDVIERPIDAVLDISGWDLCKALRLLHGSNPTLFEWSRSPIVYRTTEPFQSMLPVIWGYFSVKSSLWHYLSMAERNRRENLTGERVRAKKYFYVLRPLLACRWILEHRTPPPVRFAELTEAQLEPELRPVVEELLRKKTAAPESGMVPPVKELNLFFEWELPLLRRRAEALPQEPPGDWGPLNSLFLSVVGELGA